MIIGSRRQNRLRITSSLPPVRRSEIFAHGAQIRPNILFGRILYCQKQIVSLECAYL